MSDGVLFVGINSANQLSQAVQVTANNLANASKVGFRADVPIFNVDTVKGAGHETRHNSVLKKTVANYSHGSIFATGNKLDVAIQGEGWFAVQTPEGKEAYTRGGNFKLSPQGLLTTADGYFVKGNNGLISVPPGEITIGADGTITVKTAGAEETALSIIDRIKLVNPNNQDLSKHTDGYFYLQGNGRARVDANIRLVPGALETSNVNVVTALIDLIEYSKQYEFQVNKIQDNDENQDSARQLLQLPG